MTHRILTLQNTAMRFMTFNGPRTSATPLYAELGILKLFDLVKLMNILYVHKYLNGNLPIDTLESLEFSKTNHSYGTRSNKVGLLKRPNVNTSSYGLASFTRISSNQWNELQNHFSNLNLSELSLSRLKSSTTDFLLSSY